MRSLTAISRRSVAAMLLGSAAFGQAQRGLNPLRKRDDRWIVYYGDQEPIERFDSYSHVVFDSRYHPALPRRRRNRIAGYLSLGEASPDYRYFAELDRLGILLHPSSTWQGNRFIDLRSQRWQNLVCEELIPWILDQGFDGLFFDTLDSPLSLEEANPAQFAGMRSAAVEFVQRIRKTFPEVLLMQNRGYSLLPDVEQNIDVAVGESVFWTFDFDQKRYSPVRSDWYLQQRAWLQAAQQRRPELLVFTLDYADPADARTIQTVYEEQSLNGFVPYVATPDLRTIVAGPR